jgi:hypothetical protein
MTLITLKILISAGLVALISEVAKRSVFWGGITASLPVVSILALIWLYAETRNTKTVAELSTNIFWMVLPSLALFLILPILLKKAFAFHWALILSCIVTIAAYWAMIHLLQKFGIKL